MARIALESTPFYGSTSRPAASVTHTPDTCPACGSSLVGRYEGERTWGDKTMRVWRCPCKPGGRRRMVEVAAR